MKTEVASSGEEAEYLAQKRQEGLTAVPQNGRLRTAERDSERTNRCSCGAGQHGLTLTSSWWDNPTMILTLDAKRRLTVPANLAPAEPGDHFIAEFDPEEDAIVFRRLAKRADWLAVLRACPVEMDDVPRRSRQLPKRRRL